MSSAHTLQHTATHDEHTTPNDELTPAHNPRAHRIHSWISDQARLAADPAPRITHPRYLSVAMADLARADSPVLGFELETRDAGREKPLPVTPPLTPTPSPPLPAVTAKSHNVPLPPSFTRLSIHPKPAQANHSPSSSIHSRTSASSLPYAHSLTIHTRTSSQSSLSSPALSRRPSLARQPSLPLLGETSIFPPVPQPFSRSRSTSLASLSSLYHLPTGYEPSPRRSRFPNASQSSLSGVLTPPSTGSVRDAVYIDSEEVRERLDELLAAAAIIQPESVESYPGYLVDSYTVDSQDEHEQVIEMPQQEQGVMEIRTDGTVLAFPTVPTHVPPLSPPLTPGYYQTPYASSSQIYLGPPVTPPRPAPAPPLALDVEDEDELFFRPTGLRPPREEKSRWSMSSSVDVPLPSVPLSPTIARKEVKRRRSVSSASLASGRKEKEGKRKRLVSFISRLGGKEEFREEERDIEEEEEEEVQMPLTPATSFEAHVSSPALQEEQAEPLEEVDEEQEEWEKDLFLVKDAHNFPYPLPETPIEPSLPPGVLSNYRDSAELQQERYRASLESDDEEENVLPPLPQPVKEEEQEEAVVRRSTDDWRRGSVHGSISSPSSPVKSKPAPQTRLRSMSSLSSLSLVKLPQSSSSTYSKQSSLRSFISRMGLVSSPTPTFSAQTQGIATPRRSLVLPAEGKRKLVISGVGDDAAFDAVRRWCEAFGEVRKFVRKRGGEGEVVVVDFRERRVADMVCRLQAQVHIKGAGSVNLSWVTKK